MPGTQAGLASIQTFNIDPFFTNLCDIRSQAFLSPVRIFYIDFFLTDLCITGSQALIPPVHTFDIDFFSHESQAGSGPIRFVLPPICA